MALTKIRIGDHFKVFSKACEKPNLTGWDVSGINRDKEFFEPSTQIGSDTSKYKIVPPNYFACNLMHVGRDKVLPIAFNHSQYDKIVSPAYFVFKIKENNLLLPEYFFVLLKSKERDRYFWFHTDGSVRDGMTWDDFCDLEILAPSIEIQQKYVDVYKSMVENQKAYEKGLDDLKLVCDGFIENLRRNMPCEKIGNYIKKSEEKNIKKEVTANKAVSTEKVFIDSHALLNGVDISNYLIVHQGEFAYNTVTTRNSDKISIAINHDNDCLVSPIYTVFKVDSTKLLPEYLILWFKRKEFDRYSRYNSWGSAREMFLFEDMCEVAIPIPEIHIQKSIATIYSSYMLRRETNEKLKAQIKDLCPILIKGSLEDSLS